ncbi:inositol monophosphatase family protein [Ancylobacter radicis]|uniref:Inositol monophosphatase n=1 Tax=Ancylobacter radicis TaxID=2836179 RepID=A0ABS5R2V9_9HYPH|nr:inositol monophosphatase family protein [Ancylobacter radicis]MBS9475980.1 hypothetical protein [Ancylobacter radicis]
MTDVRALLTGVYEMVRQDLPTLLSMRRNITWKDDGSPVTDADLRVEKHVHAYLRAHLPDLTFVCEESYAPGGDESPTAWTAVLDPIDGTENFCSGFKEWGVSLSLWHEGAHAGSALLLPELGDSLMSGDKIEYQRSRIIGFSSSITDELAARVARAGEARIMGCAVYNLFNVTRGALAGFSNPAGAKSWDILAGLMLAREHGCDIDVEGALYGGHYLRPDRKYRFDIRHRYDLHPG